MIIYEHILTFYAMIIYKRMITSLPIIVSQLVRTCHYVITCENVPVNLFHVSFFSILCHVGENQAPRVRTTRSEACGAGSGG